MRFMLVSLSLFSLRAGPADAQQLSTEEQVQGFMSLFDGRTLTGWKIEAATAEDWVVRNGVIWCSGARSWLRSDVEYDNYILKIQWRFLKEKGNSGIYIRTSGGLGEKTPPNAQTHQVQTFDGPPAGMIFLGGLQARAKPNSVLKPAKPEGGEWNEFEILCNGPHIAVKLNGKLVAETRESKLTRGFVGFEGEYAPIEFRNVRLKELGWKSLFDGKSLDNWNGDKTKWTVSEGAIHLNPPGGNLYSNQTHSRNCVIRLQFRALEKAADSGVFVHGKQLQVRDYPNAGPKEYAFAAYPFGVWNDLEFDLTEGVALVKCNGQVIEKAWSVGTNAAQGLGLQSERGAFEFRYVRIREK